MSMGSQNVKQVIIGRARLASIGVTIFALAIIARLIYVQYYQTFNGKLWKDRISGTRLKREEIPASRGNIYATDGSLLATSLPYYKVGFDPCAIRDSLTYYKYIGVAARQFAAYFGDAPAEVYLEKFNRAREEDDHHVPVPIRQRLVTFEERLMMREWPFFRRDTIINKKEIDRAKREGGKVPAPVRLIGGKFDVVYQRYKPFGNMALRTVGYLNAKDGNGLVGLEASFQKELAGRKGISLVKTLSHGYKMPVEDGSDVKPEPGMDIYTTLDVNFQDIAEATLRESLVANKADKGCVLIMDVQTGALKAVANLTNVKGQYVETFNHALAGRTDPGSTFKLATMMALLEDKAIRPTDIFDVGGGSIRYRTVTISDAGHRGYGKISAQQIFEKSSNVGIHLMMQKHFYKQPERYLRYLNQFRLTKPTGFQMKGETPPVIRTPSSKGWSKISLAFMAYGYEMQLTPLQMLTFYNAVANDGKWVRPMIVREIRSGADVVEEFKPYVDPNPIASASTIRQVKRMLEGVITNGTARGIGRTLTHYTIAGKTGTAQKLINGRYQPGIYYTSFIGYFPANKPRYSMLVVVDSPRGDNVDLLMGGAVAAPVFRAIADRIFAYDVTMHTPLKGQPSAPLKGEPMAGLATDMRTISAELNLPSQPDSDGWVRTESGSQWQKQLSKNRVPDLRGMTLRDALYMLENRGFSVRFQGVGKVVAQSVAAGEPLPQPRKITLTLKPSARPDSLLKQEPLPPVTPIAMGPGRRN
ncbi:penicillin-binding protein [Tellurirhabdus rosea]|uniref:penicillin-binding protein n=1 Tax=Tellurirhabdus rosea TaxID=2674997 RepID=UPI00224DFC55|nr:penicillin-binding protein [Tellurirhabdus rosea]